MPNSKLFDNHWGVNFWEDSPLRNWVKNDSKDLDLFQPIELDPTYQREEEAFKVIQSRQESIKKATYSVLDN